MIKKNSRTEILKGILEFQAGWGTQKEVVSNLCQDRSGFNISEFRLLCLLYGNYFGRIKRSCPIACYEAPSK